MNEPVYVGPSILEVSKISRYEFWYDYVKGKYDKKSNLCYMLNCVTDFNFQCVHKDSWYL